MSTRADIRTLAEIHADQDTSGFPTTAQKNILIDAAGKRVWYDLFKAGWPMDFSTTTLTATSATTVALSAGSPAVTVSVAAIHGVYYLTAGQRIPVRRINEGNRAQLTSSNTSNGFASAYDVRVNATGGYVIELLPVAPGSQYSVDYIPEFPGFSSDATVWPGPGRSDELVALRAAMGGIRKEGEARLRALAELKLEYTETLQEVTDMASWINLREPAKIRDVISSRVRDSFDFLAAGPNGDF
jgi:hypothetical protein